MDFQIEEVSHQDARAVEMTTGSKYQAVSHAWEGVRDDDGALVLRGLTAAQVTGIRNFMYQAYGKENIIVRSKQRSDDLYNATVRDRVDGEFLSQEEQDEIQDDQEDEGDEVLPATPETAGLNVGSTTNEESPAEESPAEESSDEEPLTEENPTSELSWEMEGPLS